MRTLTRNHQPRRLSLALITVVVLMIANLLVPDAVSVLAAGNEGADHPGASLLLPGVPLYSQLANRGTEWTSCGPTALAMALNYGTEGPTPQAVVQYGMGTKGTDGTPLYQPRDPERVFTAPLDLYEIARHYGHPRMGWVSDENAAQTKLRELLGQGLPVIVDVTVALRRAGPRAAHFVLVTGIGTDNTVYVNDPYGRGTGGKRLTLAWEDFFWAWQNNSDGPVSGHGWWLVARSPCSARHHGAGPALRPLDVGELSLAQGWECGD